MKINKLNEKLLTTNQPYYHITNVGNINNTNNKFRSNWQGIHFSDTIRGAESVGKNKGYGSRYLYTVKLKSLKPLYIDIDPMSWGAVDISKLLVAYINDEKVEGATGEDFYDDEEGIFTNYRYNLRAKDFIDIDNLTKKDLSLLLPIAKINPNKISEEQNNALFSNIIDFLIKKGYNSIIYPLAEDPSSNAIIMFDSNDINIIDVKEFDKSMINENIYDGKKSNNRINKRKYRKHSMSPFCGLAPNVEKNIEMFNKANATGAMPTSSAGMSGNSNGEGMGESLLISEDIYEDNKGKWVSEDTYVPELAEDGRPYLPKEFWEDWD